VGLFDVVAALHVVRETRDFVISVVPENRAFFHLLDVLNINTRHLLQRRRAAACFFASRAIRVHRVTIRTAGTHGSTIRSAIGAGLGNAVGARARVRCTRRAYCNRAPGINLNLRFRLVSTRDEIAAKTLFRTDSIPPIPVIDTAIEECLSSVATVQSTVLQPAPSVIGKLNVHGFIALH